MNGGLCSCVVILRAWFSAEGHAGLHAALVSNPRSRITAVAVRCHPSTDVYQQANTAVIQEHIGTVSSLHTTSGADTSGCPPSRDQTQAGGAVTFLPSQ